MPHLFDPLTIRSVTLKNRIGVSPMCMYSAVDGLPNEWHLVHLGSRAVGGAALVIAEATAVEARGRITPGCTGIWSDAHTAAWAPIARFVKEHGAVPGIQIAHAGRKASTSVPWKDGHGISDDEGGWTPVGPSPVPFSDDYRMPHELTTDEIKDIQGKFVDAARRADQADFEWLELHFAHGYLASSFLSPLSNIRTDDYGGSFDNRIRFVLEGARAVRAVWPQNRPLAVRISCTEWAQGGWDIEDSIELARRLKQEGVDLVDCSSGGNVAHAKVSPAPGYQVPFADAIRAKAGIATAAVGIITEAVQANEIVETGKADMVLLARKSLRDPYFPINAAHALGHNHAVKPAIQYERAYAAPVW